MIPLAAFAACDKEFIPYLIMDNASYHNQAREKPPTAANRKAEISAWLDKKSNLSPTIHKTRAPQSQQELCQRERWKRSVHSLRIERLTRCGDLISALLEAPTTSSKKLVVLIYIIEKFFVSGGG
uniref:DDE_3 domain-containing protein n=1 Tax=Caenorhabditis tropicalis TaxID=1561998 RepID=A0A1I7ULX1_9PELO